MTDPAEKIDPRSGGWIADPDVQLMLRAKGGDTAAFRELFQRHAASLVNFAYRFVANRARAEELVQDAFMQIYRARDRYEARARFVTYLYRVTTNLCLNEVRRFEYGGGIEPLEGNPQPDGSEGYRELPDVGLPTADEHVAAREVSDRVREVLDELPANQKSALLLSRVEGFSYEETAECLATSVSAVKSLIFRATRTLRERLGDLLEE